MCDTLKIRECPFCGVTGKVSHYKGSDEFFHKAESFSIYCPLCKSFKGGHHPNSWGTLKEAIDDWNGRRRTPRFPKSAATL